MKKKVKMLIFSIPYFNSLAWLYSDHKPIKYILISLYILYFMSRLCYVYVSLTKSLVLFRVLGL